MSDPDPKPTAAEGATEQVASETQEIHASAVAYEDRGLLILGPGGSGKTTLALALMAYGAELIADDRVCLAVCRGGLIASAPPTLSGLIEIRGAGILRHPYRASARLWLAIDLGQSTPGRMPQPKAIEIASGAMLPYLAGLPASGAAAIMAILRAGHLPDPAFALHAVGETARAASHG